MARNRILFFQAYDHIAVRFYWSLPLQNRYVRRPAPPVATDLAPRHDVHMKMRNLLTSDDAVVLN